MKSLVSLIFLSSLGCGITVNGGNETITGIPTSEALVKVESYPCSRDDKEGKTLSASGMLLTHEERVYVITSEAFVYHANDPFCHSIVAPGEAKSLRLLAADWGKGIAIFEAHDLAPKDGMLTLESLSGGPLDGERVSVQGFPLRKTQLRVDEEGSVLLASSERHGIALLDRTAEVQGAFVDSGMAGGAVFHALGGVAGMISHQYLKMTLGSRTRPFDWDGKVGHWERHWVFVPGPVVKQYFEDAILKGANAPAFFRSPSDQQVGVVRVSSERTAFKIDCPTGDGGDVGDGPIGGADGVGVGGDGTSPHCKVVMGRAGGDEGVWPFEPRKKWKDGVAGEVAEGRNPEALFLVHRQTADGRLARETFRSLGEFFRLLKDRNLTPVTLVPKKPAVHGSKAARVREKGAEVSKVAKVINDFIPVPEGGLEFFRGTYFLLRVIESEEWEHVRQREVAILSDREGKHKSDWAYIAKLAPNPAEKLWQDLQALKAEVSE